MSDKLVAETSDNTQHSQQTDIHASGVIRTHNLSRRAAEDLSGHWDRHYVGSILKCVMTAAWTAQNIFATDSTSTEIRTRNIPNTNLEQTQACSVSKKVPV